MVAVTSLSDIFGIAIIFSHAFGSGIKTSFAQKGPSPNLASNIK